MFSSGGSGEVSNSNVSGALLVEQSSLDHFLFNHCPGRSCFRKQLEFQELQVQKSLFCGGGSVNLIVRSFVPLVVKIIDKCLCLSVLVRDSLVLLSGVWNNSNSYTILAVVYS